MVLRWPKSLDARKRTERKMKNGGDGSWRRKKMASRNRLVLVLKKKSEEEVVERLDDTDTDTDIGWKERKPTRCLVLNLSRVPLSELEDGMEAREERLAKFWVENLRKE